VTASRVPEVQDKLLVLFASVLPGVTILDGPAGARSLLPDVAAVGSSVDDDPAYANGDQTPLGPGNPREERYAITCGLRSVSGDQDVKARRDRVLAMATAVDDALKVDHTLGKIVERAAITGPFRWSHALTSDGAVVDLTFTISGSAYI
jgi:hypothetical protein